MNEDQRLAPRWQLLRLIEGGHQPRRGEAVELEELLDRGLVEDWTTGTWQLTDLGRQTLREVFGGGDVPAPRTAHDLAPCEARTTR